MRKLEDSQIVRWQIEELGDPPQWLGLYRSGAVAALSVVALMPVQMAVFIAFPPPDAVVGWFALFVRSPLIGLLDMDLLLIVDYVLMAIVFLAVCVALRRVSPSLAALALVLELLAVAAYFASTTAIEMLALSRAYAQAAEGAEKTALIAAGRVLLARWDGTAFTFSYALSAAAILAVGFAMLRSAGFAKSGGYAAVAVGVLSIVPANAGTPGLICSLLALVPTAAWLTVVARDLSRMNRAVAHLSPAR